MTLGISASDTRAVTLIDSELAIEVQRCLDSDRSVSLDRASRAMSAVGRAVLEEGVAVRQGTVDPDALIRRIESSLNRAVASVAESVGADVDKLCTETYRRASSDAHETTAALIECQTTRVSNGIESIRADVRDGSRDAVVASIPGALTGALWSDNTGLGRLRDDMAVLRDNMARLATRDDTAAIMRVQVDAISETRALSRESHALASSSAKGGEAESLLVGALASRLLERDGWSVRHCGTEARACDLVISREGDHPRVRVECKNKNDVTRADVAKFERDLSEQREPGVLLSLRAAVAGYSPGITFVRAAEDRYMAIVSGGGSLGSLDASGAAADLVVTAVSALHAIHAEMGSSARGSELDGTIWLDEAASERLRALVSRNEERVSSARADIQTSIHASNRALAKLRETMHEPITSALQGGEPVQAPKLAGSCPHCAKEYKIEAALVKHRECCPRRPPAPAS